MTFILIQVNFNHQLQLRNTMKQVKLLDNVHMMLEKIVKHEKENGNLGANKQSVVNELIMTKYKKVNK